MLYFGDNRYVLQEHVDSNSIDLVYLDPPFNSQARYNLLYETPGDQRESAQQTIFRDMWSWEEEADASYRAVLAYGGQIAAIVDALAVALRRSDMMAYIAMMSARLIEMRRVLKATGSLYLHCDPAASHYIKIALDAIFGYENFRNEVVWKRTSAHSSAKRWGPVHDTLLFYTVSPDYTWNHVQQKHDPVYIEKFYRHKDATGRYQLDNLTGAGRRGGDSGQTWRGADPDARGRHWAVPGSLLQTVAGDQAAGLSTQDKLDLLDQHGFIAWPQTAGGMPRLKRYLREDAGVAVQDVVTDIGPVSSHSGERIGFPTQKPTALLDRIIAASSNEGDVILDPFCGCGTTVLSAQALRRKWVGIDVSYYAVRLIQRRLIANFGRDAIVPIAGIPDDLSSAEALADNQPYGFQQWVVGELGCQLWNDGKRGADSGIDGEMRFYNPPQGSGRLLVQVKGGRRVGAPAVREFARVIDREKAQLGIFFSRLEPTAEMRREASLLGNSQIGGRSFRKLQLCWLTAWFSGIRPEMPIPIDMAVTGDRSTRPRYTCHRARYGYDVGGAA